MDKKELLKIDKLFDNSLKITHILGIRFTADAIFKLMVDFEVLREDKTLKNFMISFIKDSPVFAFTAYDGYDVHEKYKAIFDKVNIAYVFNGYLRGIEHIYAINYCIKSCSFDSYIMERVISMNTFREICAKKYICYEYEFYDIFENCLNPNKKWEKQLEEIQAYVLNDCKYYIHLESANYYELKEKSLDQNEADGIIFGFCKNTDKNIRDILLETVEEHIYLVDTKNKEYYEDCDEDFLQGDWRESLLKFKMKLECFRRVQ